MFGLHRSLMNSHEKVCLNPRDWFFICGLTIYFEKRYNIGKEHIDRIKELVEELRQNVKGSYKLVSPTFGDRKSAKIMFSRKSDALLFKLKYNTNSFDLVLIRTLKNIYIHYKSNKSF